MIVKLTLECTAAVEMLLLLQEVNVAHKWNSADCLAVLRVWDRNSFEVGVVRSIVFTLTAFDSAGDFRDDVRRTLVGRSHVAHPGSTSFTGSSALYHGCRGFQRMLEWIHLVGVGRHVD